MNLDALASKALASPLGRRVAARFGLVEATVLRRGRALPSGPVVFGRAGNGDGSLVRSALELLGVPSVEPVWDRPENRGTDSSGRDQAPAYSQPIGAVLIDATSAARVEDTEAVRAIMRPAMRAVEASGRVVIVGRDPQDMPDVEGAAVQQALDGVMRTIGKELRHGATANLIQVAAETTAQELAPVLSFLLEGRSAYVDGQPLRLSPGLTRPVASPRIVVVTGAARGIGAAIARAFAGEGASVVVVDVPAAGQALSKVANEVHGSALQLDITVPDAGRRIAEQVTGRHGTNASIAVIVHCAGILRDKLLANTDEKRWAAVLQVNLAAQLRINDQLLDASLPGGIAEGGRIISIASTSGWAGNKGQANYAASKAGVIGLVRALAPRVAGRGIVVNAVAPGFIETDMTASIPLVQREMFKRFNSLLQAGQPVDVAEAIVFLADPATPMNGQVLRVCGQNIVGL